MSEIIYTYAQLYKLRRNIPEAKLAVNQAIDLFERLGVRYKVDEARQWLQDLETGKESPLRAYPNNWYTVRYEHRDNDKAHARAHPE